MIGIVDTGLITGREDLEIVAYSVDTTLTAIDINLSNEVEIMSQITQEEFDQLLLTPAWNHALQQDGS